MRAIESLFDAACVNYARANARHGDTGKRGIGNASIRVSATAMAIFSPLQ
jgi:hypothetical protein